MTTTAASATATYHCAWPSGIGYIPSASPCGPINSTDQVVPCCANGDYCLTDNICGYTSHSDDGGSGYYSAGCTNATFIDDGSNSACSNRCADTGLPDVVYDSSDGVWKCCGGSEAERNCASPTNETFVGAAPSDLITIWLAGEATTSTSASILSTSAAASVTTSTASATSAASIATPTTPTTVPNSSINDSSGLSAGAKAGIGIGAAIGALALLAVALVYIRRRQKRTIAYHAEGTIQKPPEQTVAYRVAPPKKLSELDTAPIPVPQELSTRPVAELHGSSAGE